MMGVSYNGKGVLFLQSLDITVLLFTRLSLDTRHMMYIQGSNIWLQVAIRM